MNPIQDQVQKAIESYNRTIWHARGMKYDDAEGKKRDSEETDETLWNAFHVDNERIVASKAFRRLKHKTQVFWAPRNDHYRTRLTHTIEVAHTARRIGFELGLNIDLISAIALGHDVGHPPFGHAGERALQGWVDTYRQKQNSLPPNKRDVDFKDLPDPFNFDHHEWGLELLQKLESLSVQRASGLNLTQAVQHGIKNPSINNTTSLEAAVVGVSDDLTWISHDHDDFRHAGLALPEPAFQATRQFGGTRPERLRRAIRTIVKNSRDDGTRVVISEDLKSAIQGVRQAYYSIYIGHDHWQRHEEGSRVVLTHLLDFYMNSTEQEIREVIKEVTGRDEQDIGLLRRWLDEGVPKAKVVVEYVAKMTDTFALDVYRHLFSPEMSQYFF